MDSYDWKLHYAMPFVESGKKDAFVHYHIENETGEGTVIACPVLPGVQAIYNVLNMERCGRPVTPNENVIQINYCIEGRYECTLNRQYCFFVGPGDFSVGTVGRKESGGGFPTRRFRGISVFLEMGAFSQDNANIIQDLEIDLDKIWRLSQRKPRYFVLHQGEGLDAILMGLADGFTKQ